MLPIKFILHECLRFGLAFIFLSSGTWKVVHYKQFLDSLNAFHLFSGITARLSISLILIEIWTGGGLLFKRTSLQAAFVASILLATFTILLAAEYISGSRGDCGCGTLVLSERIGVTKILEDCFVLLLTIYYMCHQYLWTKLIRKEVNQNEIT